MIDKLIDLSYSLADAIEEATPYILWAVAMIFMFLLIVFIAENAPINPESCQKVLASCG